MGTNLTLFIQCCYLFGHCGIWVGSSFVSVPHNGHVFVRRFRGRSPSQHGFVQTEYSARNSSLSTSRMFCVFMSVAHSGLVWYTVFADRDGGVIQTVGIWLSVVGVFRLFRHNTGIVCHYYRYSLLFGCHYRVHIAHKSVWLSPFLLFDTLPWGSCNLHLCGNICGWNNFQQRTLS